MEVEVAFGPAEEREEDENTIAERESVSQSLCRDHAKTTTEEDGQS